MLPIAIDAMGGDNAPESIVEGARIAADRGIDVVLVGQPERLIDLAGDLPMIAASEVIAMDDDPGTSVRTKKDSSLVRAAEAVRDGSASAMVSAGNTGATMASALFRMGRIKGFARPAIAAPLPVLGAEHPTVLLDSGANAEVQADWVAQFARMGAVYARDRFGIARPRVGLLSIGEEAGKGSPLVKEIFGLLSESEWQEALDVEFIGNVEGRDLFDPAVDVVVTDGFTGNVALKTAEGAARMIVDALLAAFESSDDARAGAALLAPSLASLYAQMNPDTVGGAMLLGVKGVCVISHGSSSPEAIVNAVEVAKELVERGMVDDLTAAAAV
ncbi:MAG: phosphate acyltransferase PlsX [Acidimicrobiia bacterium]|nr:phosphate acyltransferase PlsX [Acidimicrobiia bacterium]